MSLVSTFSDARSVIRKNFGVAVAIALGLAINNFVRAIIDNLVMPLLDPVLNEVGSLYDWKQAHIDLGPFSFPVGVLVSEVITFIVFMAALYIFVQGFESVKVGA
jgi:large-conductance mechanosensitive channel